MPTENEYGYCLQISMSFSGHQEDFGSLKSGVRTGGALKEFHVSRAVRDTHGIDEYLFTSRGNLIFPNFHAVRLLAQKINDTRDAAHVPERSVRAGHLNAMGLIDEILHYVVELYRDSFGSRIFSDAFQYLSEKVGKEDLEKTLSLFTDAFPPLAVYKGDSTVAGYLDSEDQGISGRELAIEELLLLWLANANPAFGPFAEFFDDADLKKNSAYDAVIGSLRDFFESKPFFGPDDQNLIDMLRSPALAQPLSLSGQLAYMREHWGMLLGKYLFRLLSGLDFLKEEEKVGFLGPGKAEVYSYEGMDADYEGFSEDKEWMPRVVLLAKTALVWLDQLSGKYERSITKLDQVPDEELDELARRGFTGLWLIGIWERSRASKRIKQLCGNPEAESSAYSLMNYEIAESIGGWESLLNLRGRCQVRGIRLASDMVPNHTAIDSEWVIKHPDWFVQLGHSPFPAYTYSGENLSHDERVRVFIEDHYYSKSDASVTFRRTDSWTGDTRFIYHGNDGTAMPWNDTAQLNFLLPEVREAVIRTILHVASNFPIIRFDAAMTLTKKHFHRLWFPAPGSGGDIPSRAEHGMTRDAFEKAMPDEFWREVVDRVAAEAPETLLLAEAFWLMEGYFVRTLGMHRVYNSAFMNMLKNEENLNYRNTIKNTQEFDPDILKRFVNFMNNPDEDTAVAQFGKGDKYFGVCTMMVTMPGLPMFGHGQIEGFSEKYGMEYKKAYWDEKEDQGLLERHRREIFPLMKKRYLFAGVENFLLFDLYDEQGNVNENVFAFTNKYGNEAAFVLYNNSFAKASGRITLSAARSFKNPDSGDKHLARNTLAEAFSLHNDGRFYCVFRELRCGLYFIRNSAELSNQGLFVVMNGYENQVFTDFREVEDNDMGHYSQAAATVAGKGFADLDELLKEIFLNPLHNALYAAILEEFFESIEDCVLRAVPVSKSFFGDFEIRYFKFLGKTAGFLVEQSMMREPAEGILQTLTGSAIRALKVLTGLPDTLKKLKLNTVLNLTPETPAVLASWALFKSIGLFIDDDLAEGGGSLYDEWLLKKPLRFFFDRLNPELKEKPDGAGKVGKWDSGRMAFTVKLLILNQNWFSRDGFKDADSLAHGAMERFFSCEETRRFLGENRYDGVLYFNKECFSEFIWWMFTVALLTIIEMKTVKRDLPWLENILRSWINAEEKSGYKVEDFLLSLERLVDEQGKNP